MRSIPPLLWVISSQSSPPPPAPLRFPIWSPCLSHSTLKIRLQNPERSPSKVSSRWQGLARIVQRTLGSEAWPPSGSLSWSRSGSLGIKPKDPSISHVQRCRDIKHLDTISSLRVIQPVMNYPSGTLRNVCSQNFPQWNGIGAGEYA